MEKAEGLDDFEKGRSMIKKGQVVDACKNGAGISLRNAGGLFPGFIAITYGQELYMGLRYTGPY